MSTLRLIFSLIYPDSFIFYFLTYFCFVFVLFFLLPYFVSMAIYIIAIGALLNVFLVEFIFVNTWLWKKKYGRGFYCHAFFSCIMHPFLCGCFTRLQVKQLLIYSFTSDNNFGQQNLLRIVLWVLCIPKCSHKELQWENFMILVWFQVVL